jgi:transcriptional regulator with XRE-family HTH domain
LQTRPSSASPRGIRELRAERGWWQERLAEEADLHRTYIGGVERSLRNVSLFNIAKLAHAFGIPIAETVRAGAEVSQHPSEMIVVGYFTVMLVTGWISIHWA